MTKIILADDKQHPHIDVMDHPIEIGQWFWVSDDYRQKGETIAYEWLGCISLVGSNYIEIEGLHSERNGYKSRRIHFNDIYQLRVERDHQRVIDSHIAQSRQLIKGLLDDVKAVTARLGLQQQSIGQQVDASTSNGQELAVLSAQPEVSSYKTDLIDAKKTALPDLFKKIKEENSNLAMWMTAEALPMQIMSRGLSDIIEAVDSRIFNVSLYAGLTEEVVQCQAGEPADVLDKLHVMQRKLYADEECLLSYESGGIDITNLKQFDDWLCDTKNLNRILPFPRSIVAMQVRRETKERDSMGNIGQAIINVSLAGMDKITFLLVRNNEQVYRINCELDFDDLIFPDQQMIDNEAVMVMMRGSKVERTISVNEYDDRLAESNAERVKYDQWNAENSSERSFYNPYSRCKFNSNDWTPFNSSSVYFDDISKDIANQIKKYNRIALIIQGLLDRSEVLHPHVPIKTWEPESFNQFIEMVSDGSSVLHYKEAPDFDAYRDKCNASMNADSIVIGQDIFWLKKEAEKESRRLDNDYRNHAEWRPKVFQPYGNPGPGYLAKMSRWQAKAKKASFSWLRGRMSDHYSWDEDKRGDIKTSLTVPADQLFNVSAYTPGDFKMFFHDPRTRQHYLKWAPMLMAAEEYYAGNIEVIEPYMG